MPRGGVMMLVDKRLACQLVFAETSENSQLVGVWVEHVLLWAFYSPPSAGHVGADHDPQYEISDLFTQGFHTASPGPEIASWLTVCSRMRVICWIGLFPIVQSFWTNLLVLICFCRTTS